MKKTVVILALLFIGLQVFPNISPTPYASISELYFDTNGDWHLEILLYNFDSEDTSIIIYSSTDTARYHVCFDTIQDLFTITNDDLYSSLDINAAGDCLSLVVGGYSFHSEYCLFGNFLNSMVSAPKSGQSLVSLTHDSPEENAYIVKDSSPSLGFIRDPQRGTFNGFVYDSQTTEIPYLLVKHELNYGLQKTWSNENGFFENTAMYARNYRILIDNGGIIWYDSIISIEPDSTTTISLNIPASAYNELTGYCRLKAYPYHHNSLITLTSSCPFKPLDTIRTDTSGYYSLSLSFGNYYFRFSHNGYLPMFNWEYDDITSDQYWGVDWLDQGNVNEINRGAVLGNWDKPDPYWIFGDIYIDESDSLFISPGTEIIFKGPYTFNVFGKLFSMGSEESPVSILNDNDLDSNWLGIHFYEDNSSSSLIEYTIFQDYINPITINNSSPTIIHNSFFESGYHTGIELFGSSAPLLSHNTNSTGNNYGGSAYRCFDSTSPIIEYQKFSVNTFAITCYNHSTPTIQNNTFVHQMYNSIETNDNASPIILNNIFYNTGSIITGGINTPGYNLFYNSYSYNFFCNDCPSGFQTLATTNLNGDSCDMYYNLFMNPKFQDTTYWGAGTLTYESPCIDAGDPGFPYDPDSTIADIGAFFFDQNSVYINPQLKKESGYTLKVQPNPNKGNATIILEKEKDLSWNTAVLRFYDLYGRMLSEQTVEFLLPQDNEYRIELNNLYSGFLSSGTYLLSLQINNQIIATQKTIITDEP